MRILIKLATTPTLSRSAGVRSVRRRALRLAIDGCVNPRPSFRRIPSRRPLGEPSHAVVQYTPHLLMRRGLASQDERDASSDPKPEPQYGNDTCPDVAIGRFVLVVAGIGPVRSVIAQRHPCAGILCVTAQVRRQRGSTKKFSRRRRRVPIQASDNSRIAACAVAGRPARAGRGP